MRVRKLSADFDYSFGNGAADFYIDSPDGVAQIVQTALLLWLGEWYLDVTVGMPWLEGVLGKHNKETADVTVQDYIVNVPFVTGLQDFKSVDSRDIRLYSAASVINTLFGPTAIEIANQPLF